MNAQHCRCPPVIVSVGLTMWLLLSVVFEPCAPTLKCIASSVLWNEQLIDDWPKS